MEHLGLVIIVTQKYGSDFSKKLESGINALKERKIIINVEEKLKPDNWAWYCFLDNKNNLIGDLNSIIKHYLSGVISDFIMEYMRASILEELLKRDYSYFNKSERGLILRLTLHKLSHKENKNKYLYDRNEVLCKLVEHFQMNHYINLEGFFNFRVKNHMAELKNNIELTIDDFLAEQEYQDYINLLKYFVNLQEPKIDEIHIIIDDTGSFQLKDNNLKLLDYEQTEGLGLNFYNAQIEKADILISSLIKFVPQNVIMHKNLYRFYPKAVEAILNIFGDRVTVCKDCQLCLKQNIIF